MKWNRRRKILVVFLLIVVAVQGIGGLGDYYAQAVYPCVATVLTFLSGYVPFAIGDLFITLSIIGIVAFPFYAVRRKNKTVGYAIAGVGEYLLWLYVWFYLAWGLNYAQSDFYHRSHTPRYEANDDQLRHFAWRYADSLNATYSKTAIYDTLRVPSLVVAGYKRLAQQNMGVHAPFHVHTQAKTMIFTPLSSKVGVTGSMGPFFCEFTLNGDLRAHEYPSTFAHEYAHLLGITNEGEANFYAYQVCTSSADRTMRFCGYYAIFFHVLRSVDAVLGDEAAEDFLQYVRPEIRQMASADRYYWRSKYSTWLGNLQNAVYEFYLRTNRVDGGRKSYSQVVALILSWEQRQGQMQRR